MAEGNAKHKDKLFEFIFGTRGSREWTLSLYNAVNHSHYDDPAAIEINIIQNTMYLGMRNDVSFIIADEMNIYEQQSSFNPNMPLRMFLYAAHLYEKYLEEHGLNNKAVYSTRLVELPLPKLAVFYNAERGQLDEMTFKLSDAFKSKNSKPDIEVQVKMLNINYGHNKALLESCKVLGEYSWITAEIRAHKELELKYAIDRAIINMPKEFILKKFLLIHRAEVMGMLVAEYDSDEAKEIYLEDERERIFNELVADGMSPEKAAKYTRISLD